MRDKGQVVRVQAVFQLLQRPGGPENGALALLLPSFQELKPVQLKHVVVPVLVVVCLGGGQKDFCPLLLGCFFAGNVAARVRGVGRHVVRPDVQDHGHFGVFASRCPVVWLPDVRATISVHENQLDA